MISHPSSGRIGCCSLSPKAHVICAAISESEDSDCSANRFNQDNYGFRRSEHDHRIYRRRLLAGCVRIEINGGSWYVAYLWTRKFNSFCKGQSRKPASTILVKDGARALFARFLLWFSRDALNVSWNDFQAHTYFKCTLRVKSLRVKKSMHESPEVIQEGSFYGTFCCRLWQIPFFCTKNFTDAKVIRFFVTFGFNEPFEVLNPNIPNISKALFFTTINFFGSTWITSLRGKVYWFQSKLGKCQ